MQKDGRIYKYKRQKNKGRNKKSDKNKGKMF